MEEAKRTVKGHLADTKRERNEMGYTGRENGFFSQQDNSAEPLSVASHPREQKGIHE